MKKLVCIVCPKGCVMEIEGSGEDIKVIGNSCSKGFRFALSESVSPMRSVCTTVKTVFPDAPVLPVRTSSEIPKDKIFDVMREINKVCVNKKIGRGEKVIENVLGLGADIIATSSMLKKI